MTRRRVLTIDLGNSRCSAATVVEGSAPEPLGAWDAADEFDLLRVALEELGRGGARPSLAAVSAVGSVAREERVATCLADLGLEVALHPDPGLEFRIDHPESCGSDRKYAARGALDARDGATALVVVDAGTALTVDAVLATPGAAHAGAFLGGAIALGPGSLASALAAAGARLPAFGLDPDAPALGRSTEAALRAGVVVGFRGTVRELCRHVAAEAFGDGAEVAAFLTGGARGAARAATLDVFGPRVVEDPLLVHRGLAAAVRGLAP